MKTKEIEKATGISARNLQFYEKEGLLSPERNSDNGYRNYTQKDLIRIEQIKLLRMLGLSVADIKLCLNNKISLGQKLAERKISIAQEMNSLEKANAVCDILIERNAEINDIQIEDCRRIDQDTAVYYAKLKAIEANDKRKRRRYQAKLFIQLLLALCLGAFFGLAGIKSFLEASHYPWAGIILLALVIIYIGIVIAKVIQHEQAS